MGDMKTPDFDDLLAAFDIPDATGLDAKEAIPENHDEAESHLKHSGICVDDSIPLSNTGCPADIPAVSVIVKNTSRQESYESIPEKDSQHFGDLLHNGLRNSSVHLDLHHVNHGSLPKTDIPSTNGDCSRCLVEKGMPNYKAEKLSSFTKALPQFSPISSPESEDMHTNGATDDSKQTEGSFYPTGSLFASAESPVPDNQRRKQPGSLIDLCQERDPHGETVNVTKTCNVSDKDEKKCHDQEKPAATCSVGDVLLNSIEEKHRHPFSETNATLSPKSVKPLTSKLSSCLEALEALNARRDSSEVGIREASTHQSESMKVSPKVAISPRSPRSPLEVVKQRLIKQPDSPMSICSDSSGKASPALAPSSSPAIPKVRIKTIKTLSGQIKRTVTSVLPDSEAEDLNSSMEWSPAPSSVEESSCKTTPVHHSPDMSGNIIFENDKSCSPRAPASGHRPVKTKSPGSFKKASSQNTAAAVVAGSGIRRTPQGQRPKKGLSVQTVGVPNSGFIPKALHLANLNLVPHSVAASVTARSSSQRQSQSSLSSSVVHTGVPLVHQVKKVPPNSRTVMPNTAAMTLNRLLNYSNPVPTYVPNLNPPPECNISLPTQGFNCVECGDSFGLQKSLAGHYSRKSVHIEVTCTHCAKTLVFYNKCALLAHAREHKNKGIVMQCTQLFMKPIPVDQMFTPSTLECPLSVCSPATSMQATRSQQPVMPLYPDKVIRHGLKCLECNKQMSDYRALAGHYQRLSEESDELMCKVCTMLLPNKCSFKAHQRIHNHKSPYCCPECGAVSRSVDIQKHVKENCLHYCRKFGYKCIHCEMLYVSFAVLKTHIEEKHCEVFHKCTACPVAFKTSDGCVVHIKNKHKDNTLSPQIIYKCSCKTMFKRKQLLFQHFSQRAKKSAVSVFKCPECTAFFMQKQLLVQHFKEVHGGVFSKDGAWNTNQTDPTTQRHEIPVTLPQPPASSFTDAAEKGTSPSACKSGTSTTSATTTTATVSMRNTGWTCGECLLWLPDRDTYVTHMKTSHGKSVKRYPCRNCERSFNSSMSLRRHIRNDHAGKKKVYTCWYCTDKKQTFNQHFMLKNHISLMHGIKNPDFSQMSKMAHPETNKLSREAVKRCAEENRVAGSDLDMMESSSAKRMKPQFRCSKCGFTALEQSLFLEHIPQHKSHPDTPQCHHCGLCYTSQLALSRHLFIVHKIKEPENEEEEEEEEVNNREGAPQPVKERQCQSPEEKKATLAENSSERESQPSLPGKSAQLQCDDCSETFNEGSSCHLHVQTHKEMSGTQSIDTTKE